MESEESYREIFNATNDAILIHDLESGEVLDLNTLAIELFGFQKSELNTLSKDENFNSNYPFNFSLLEKYYKDKSNRYIRVLELKSKNNYGKSIWIEIALNQSFLRGRSVLIASIRDISERKDSEVEKNRLYLEMQEKVKELNCLYAISKAIQENSDPYVVFQEAVKVIPYSWKFPHLTCARIKFGEHSFVSEEFKESPWRQVSELSVEGFTMGVVEVFYKEERSEEFEGPFRYEERNLIDAIAALLSQMVNRNMYEVELKKAREVADAANDAKTKFLANMSHEIRSPLNAILGFSQIMMNKIEGNEYPQFFKEYLGNIKTSGKNLSALINDILDLSKIEAGKITIVEDSFELEQTIRAVFQINKDLARDKEIKYHYELLDGVPKFIKADKTRLMQIILNLVSNALKFTPEKKEVSIKVYCDQIEGVLFIEVKDSGVGIPPSRQESVFLPFEQADASTTREYGGTGLGLAISRQLVGLMGGEIKLESELDKGSIFTVSLPIQETWKSTYAPQERDFGSYDFRKDVKILAVEDNFLNRKMLKALFIELGLQLTIVNNGKEGLRIAKKMNPNLILMDIHMPIMDGLECTRKIRQDDALKAIPIIGISADAFEDAKKRALEAGMNNFITKPIEISKLVDSLAVYLSANDNSNSQLQRKGKAVSEEVYTELLKRLDGLSEIEIFKTEELVKNLVDIEKLVSRYNHEINIELEMIKSGIYKGDKTLINKGIISIKNG